MAKASLAHWMKELERLTPLLLEAVVQKEYEQFITLQQQQEAAMDHLLDLLKAMNRDSLSVDVRTHLQNLLQQQEALQLDVAGWTEEIKQELLSINQGQRANRGYAP